MADLFQVAARLRAMERGQAIPIVTQRQVVIQPHALVLTMLAMAGEDTSVHAVAVGGLGQPADINIVADPRRRDDQYELLRWLLPRFETYFAQCRVAATFPQIWVSSSGALGHLDTLADRLRFTDDPEVQRLGMLWTYAGERSPVAGQQALISATAALRAHFATGQQEAEDEHLAALLTWIEPPQGRDIFAAVAMAEAQPMGVKTDPAFDKRQLQPALEQFNSARTAGSPPHIIAAFRSQIQQQLETVLRPIYAATQRAITLLQAPRWQPNTALGELAAQEARDFARFMEARDQGHRLPYRDSAKAGAFKIAARERAASNTEAGTLRHDRAAREKAVASGTILRATVRDIVKTHPAPRLFDYHFTLESAQTSLHLRSGDILWAMDGATISMRVEGVERRGAVTQIRAVTVKGKNTVKLMVPGGILDLGPEAPDWFALGNELGQMASRLAAPPWTHGDALPAAVPVTRPMPTNLLAAVEALA